MTGHGSRLAVASLSFPKPHFITVFKFCSTSDNASPFCLHLGRLSPPPCPSYNTGHEILTADVRQYVIPDIWCTQLQLCNLCLLIATVCSNEKGRMYKTVAPTAALFRCYSELMYNLYAWAYICLQQTGNTCHFTSEIGDKN